MRVDDGKIVDRCPVCNGPVECGNDLADEAFRDLLNKHRRPVTLKEMLRESAWCHPANEAVFVILASTAPVNMWKARILELLGKLVVHMLKV